MVDRRFGVLRPVLGAAYIELRRHLPWIPKNRKRILRRQFLNTTAELEDPDAEPDAEPEPEMESDLARQMSFGSAATAASTVNEFTSLLSSPVDNEDANPGTDVEMAVERGVTGGDAGVPPDQLKSKPQVRDMVRKK